MVKPGAKVITIETAQDALSVEEVVEVFCTVFTCVCALKAVDELSMDSFT
jgi:methionine synthase I (cobalamin-dependent)